MLNQVEALGLKIILVDYPFRL